MADIEVYTKLEHLANLAQCDAVRQMLRAEAAKPMGQREAGFQFNVLWAKVNAEELAFKQMWGKSQRTMDALRKAKFDLGEAERQNPPDGDLIKALTRKVGFLKMLTAKILAGVERENEAITLPDPDPEIRLTVPCPVGCKRTNAHKHWAPLEA